jgi:hypothetical protein
MNTTTPWSAERAHVAVEGGVDDAHLIWESTYLSSDVQATAGNPGSLFGIEKLIV